MKSASNGRQPQNIKSGTSQQPLIGSYSHFKLRLRWPKYSAQILQMKTTSRGRQPQNIKSGISQQPLIGSYSNFKLELRLPKIKCANPWNEDNLKWKTTSKYQKGNISETTVWIMTSSYRKTQGNPERKSRVWLCSAQVVPFLHESSQNSFYLCSYKICWFVHSFTNMLTLSTCILTGMIQSS
jgi:hypothetical protein